MYDTTKYPILSLLFDIVKQKIPAIVMDEDQDRVDGKT